jgi:hypothetical protein
LFLLIATIWITSFIREFIFCFHSSLFVDVVSEGFLFSKSVE